VINVFHVCTSSNKNGRFHWFLQPQPTAISLHRDLPGKACCNFICQPLAVLHFAPGGQSSRNATVSKNPGIICPSGKTRVGVESMSIDSANLMESSTGFLASFSPGGCSFCPEKAFSSVIHVIPYSFRFHKSNQLFGPSSDRDPWSPRLSNHHANGIIVS